MSAEVAGVAWDSDAEWAAIELAHDARVEASALLMLCRRMHERHLVELRRSERMLVFAVRRAERARRIAERAGRLLEQACLLRARVQ